ncbi:uncharacterized protein EI97DRAFT_35867 [Westerdykella ornata]|uniref:Uncharacterized protein n=1 Tax=Westerdykella ornata TaxID=318751 RepID=A0A6A6JI55_WESOR|nr:uncharacterized protein EI97DRAFT_35867 [Westerdykella ornata]KAF2276330.1 hypothetical protein EI97DRAFT_35867 [Westerdykella ornata]
MFTTVAPDPTTSPMTVSQHLSTSPTTTVFSHSTRPHSSNPRTSPPFSTMTTSTSTVTAMTPIVVSTNGPSAPTVNSSPPSMDILTPAPSSTPDEHNSNNRKPNTPLPTPVPTSKPISTTAISQTIPLIPHGNLTLKSIDTTNTPYPHSDLRSTPPKWHVRRCPVLNPKRSLYRHGDPARAGTGAKQGFFRGEPKNIDELDHEGEGVATLPIFEGDYGVDDVRQSVEVDIHVDAAHPDSNEWL